MKHISKIFCVACLLLLTSSPALADLTVTFVNRTDFEIQSIDMKGDSGGMGSGINVVPGNFCVFKNGSSKELREVKIDVGLMLFTFTDMAALAGNSAPQLELTYDANDRPHLTLLDKPVQSNSGQTDAESSAEDDSASGNNSFDLPAGPIWNNDHAKERCPEVLEEWLAANPGKQAEWNGNWLTVTPGEASVCSINLLESAAAPASDSAPAPAVEPAVPSLINIVGTATAFADPSVESATELSAVTGAENMGAIRAMGAQQAPIWDSHIYLPVTFAGKTWAAFVEPAETFSRDNATKPGDCLLRTYTGGVEGLTAFMQNFAAQGYRPWFAQLSAGENMDTEGMARFWQEDTTSAKAWEQITDAGVEINEAGKPASIKVILLTEEGYAKAAAGKNEGLSGFQLRISNADVIVLQYQPDISSLVSMTR